MLVRFLTDQSISGEGWNMAYNPVYPSSTIRTYLLLNEIVSLIMVFNR